MRTGSRRQFAGLGQDDIVQSDVVHEGRVGVLLGHNRVFQRPGDLPVVAAFNGVNNEHLPRRQLLGDMTVEDLDQPAVNCLGNSLAAFNSTSELASSAFCKKRLPGE